MNVVGWLTGGLFGGSKADQAASDSEGEEDFDGASHSPPTHDDTINYDTDENENENQNEHDDDGDIGMSEAQDNVPSSPIAPHRLAPSSSMSSSRTPSSSSNPSHFPFTVHTNVPSTPFAPAPAPIIASAPFQSPSPAPAPFQTPVPSTANRPSFASAAFGASTVPLTPFGAASPAPAIPPHTPVFGKHAPQLQQANSPDVQLRSAFSAYESGNSGVAASQLESLLSNRPQDVDPAVCALARRTGDSRHIHDGVDESVALVGELRTKARRYEALLQFVRSPMLRSQRGPQTLWSKLTHTTQTQLLETGELLECALSLKLLLNSTAASLRSDGLVTESSELIVSARRSLAMEWMEQIVGARPEGLALRREGLSVQDIFFSETSRLPDLFPAVQAALTHQEERSVFASHATSITHERLMKIAAAIETIHTLLIASKGFETQPTIATCLSERSPLVNHELPATSWLLGAHVRESIKSIVQTAIDTIVDLTPTTRITSGGQTMTTFESAAWQAQVFEQVQRIVRVYLQGYTSVLSTIANMRQGGTLSSVVSARDDELHSEFVHDRSLLLNHLIRAARHMTLFNYQTAAVFVVPPTGLVGVPPPHFPPFQPMYEIAQEFQDYMILFELSLSEERDIADRRLIFFLAHYGIAFMKVIVEELLKREDVPRLLELANVATVELPNYVRGFHARGESFYVRDANGEALQLDADGRVNGVPLYDMWLHQFLEPLPQYAWLHEIHQAQWNDAARLLKSEARNEKMSLSHKKTLLSLSKLSLLAGVGSDPMLDGGMTRSISDSSIGSNASTDANSSELNAINDELSGIIAQQFLQAGQESVDENGEEKPQPVLPPNELIQKLIEAGLDQSHPSTIRVHSFCFAFDVLEKNFLPKTRSTQFERYSPQNQESMINIWRGCVIADADRWASIAQAKQADPSDAWEAQLAETQLGLVWRELMKKDLKCYQHEHVYFQSFLHLLHNASSLLPLSLQSNEIRLVLERVPEIAKAATTTGTQL